MLDPAPGRTADEAAADAGPFCPRSPPTCARAPPVRCVWVRRTAGDRRRRCACAASTKPSARPRRSPPAAGPGWRCRRTARAGAARHAADQRRPRTASRGRGAWRWSCSSSASCSPSCSGWSRSDKRGYLDPAGVDPSGARASARCSREGRRRSPVRTSTRRPPAPAPATRASSVPDLVLPEQARRLTRTGAGRHRCSSSLPSRRSAGDDLAVDRGACRGHRSRSATPRRRARATRLVASRLRRGADRRGSPSDGTLALVVRPAVRGRAPDVGARQRRPLTNGSTLDEEGNAALGSGCSAAQPVGLVPARPSRPSPRRRSFGPTCCPRAVVPPPPGWRSRSRCSRCGGPAGSGRSSPSLCRSSCGRPRRSRAGRGSTAADRARITPPTRCARRRSPAAPCSACRGRPGRPSPTLVGASPPAPAGTRRGRRLLFGDPLRRTTRPWPRLADLDHIVDAGAEVLPADPSRRPRRPDRPLRRREPTTRRGGPRARSPLRAEVAKAVVGQDAVVTGLVIALLCRGHVLLEGVPGVAKTLLVRALATALTLQTKRVQFTPDLMPGDVTGSLVYDARTGEFSFREGRSSPTCCSPTRSTAPRRRPRRRCSRRWRSGRSRWRGAPAAARPVRGRRDPEPGRVRGHLPAAGGPARPLPAQAHVPLPAATRRSRVLTRHADGFDPRDLAAAGVGRWPAPPTSPPARRRARSGHVAPEVLGYVVDLAGPPGRRRRCSWACRRGARPPCSPPAEAWAWLSGRDYVTPDDVKALARPALRHRVRCAPRPSSRA